LAVLLEFLAAEWDVRLLLAKTTARLTALGVLASKLLVNLDWQTLHLEVAKWAF
jgi:hypothetical protein